MIVVPAFAHAAVLDRIEPYLGEAAIVACLPTRGGFESKPSRFALGRSEKRPPLVGLQTLPWSARVVKPGESVLFNAVKERVALAALPAHDEARTCRPLLADPRDRAGSRAAF